MTQSSNSKVHRVGKITYLTQSTKEAAALLALGVPLQKEDPFVRVYTAKRPKGTPGEVTYQFNPKSVEFGTDANKLGGAYAEKIADKTLDAKLTELYNLSLQVQERAAMKGDEETVRLVVLLREAMELLPEAMAVYIRAALDMRERLIKFVMEDAPRAGERGLVRVDKNGKTVIFSETLSPDKRKALVS